MKILRLTVDLRADPGDLDQGDTITRITFDNAALEGRHPGCWMANHCRWMVVATPYLGSVVTGA